MKMYLFCKHFSVEYDIYFLGFRLSENSNSETYDKLSHRSRRMTVIQWRKDGKIIRINPARRLLGLRFAKALKKSESNSPSGKFCLAGITFVCESFFFHGNQSKIHSVSLSSWERLSRFQPSSSSSYTSCGCLVNSFKFRRITINIIFGRQPYDGSSIRVTNIYSPYYGL